MKLNLENKHITRWLLYE